MIRLHDILYVLRVLVAVALALAAAYVIQLDSPASAAATVMIVANPMRGALLSKSFWRLLGSVAGGLAAVGLMAAFAQSPLLFVAGLAVWIGLCTFVSSLLRYFRSYAAVLAGFTVTLVVFGALKQPDHIFELALSRVAVVGVGVVCCALVFLITAPAPGRSQLRKLLAQTTHDAITLLRDALEGDSERGLLVRRHAIGGSIAALDQAMEFAAAEDAALAQCAGMLRLAAANLFALILGGLYAAQRLRHDAPVQAALFGRLLAGIDLADPDPMRLDRMAAKLQADHPQAGLAELAAQQQACALTAQLRVVCDTLAALDAGRQGQPSASLPVYVNFSTALRNGMRAALAMGLAGWFWIESNWTAGPAMLTVLGPMAGLLAQADSASAASKKFFIGTIVTVIASFVCTFGVLPPMGDFAGLIAGIAPFLALAIWASTHPAWNPYAVPSLIFFLGIVGAGNPMVFDLDAFLNNALGYILGAACGFLTFTVLLPPNPIAEAAYLSRSVHRALARLARRPAEYSLGWEHLQHQKLIRLSRRLAPFPDRRIAAVQDAEKSVLIGRRLGQIDAMLHDPSLPPENAKSVQTLRSSLQNLTISESDALAVAQPMAAANPASRHLAACLYDLAKLLQRGQKNMVVA